MTTERRSRAARSFAVGLVILLVAGCSPASPSGTTSHSASALPSPSGLESSNPSPARPSPSEQAGFVALRSLPAAALDDARTAKLQEALEAAIRYGAPDVIASVITEEGTWAGAAGIAGPGGRKATADDEFAIASLSKTLTAVLLMRLAEKGTIDLDAPVAEYMGEVDVDTNGATVRQLLAMRGGLADSRPDAKDLIGADPSRAWTWAERIAGFPPPILTPGEYHYSSPSYELLAFAAEQATGVSYGQALRAEILDPVGADRILDQEVGGTTPQPWAVPIDEHLGGYDETDIGAGGAISCISSASFGTGAGSVASDAPSLARWLWHLFAGDILEVATLDPMITAGLQGWAYGFESAPYTEPDSLANSGSKTGYGAQWVYFPKSRAIVVIFVNDPDFIVEPTVSALLAAAVGP